MEQIYDIAVIGAGPSGIAAAYYAAKQGAKTVLLEKDTIIGGTALAAYVHTIAGEPDMDGLLAGIHTRAWGSVIFHPEELVDRFYSLLESQPVDILCSHEVISVETNEHKITSLVCATEYGKTKIAAKYFIDASGTSQIETLTGQKDSGLPPYCYMTGLIGKIETVGGKCYSEEAISLLKEKVERSKEKGTLSAGLYINIHPTVRADIALLEIKYDNSGSLSGAVMRKKLNEAVKFMQEFGYGFENASLICSSKEIFYSAQGSFNAQYTLTYEDVAEGKYFSAQVAQIAYKDAKKVFIPYGSLLSSAFENVLLCGRNIGAATNAISEINSIPAHYKTGKAAGIACSIAVANNIPLASVSAYEVASKSQEGLPRDIQRQSVSFESIEEIKERPSGLNIISEPFSDDEMAPAVKSGETKSTESFEELDKFLSLLSHDAPPAAAEPQEEEHELLPEEEPPKESFDFSLDIDGQDIIHKEPEEKSIEDILAEVGEFSNLIKSEQKNAEADILGVFDGLEDISEPCEEPSPKEDKGYEDLLLKFFEEQALIIDQPKEEAEQAQEPEDTEFEEKSDSINAGNEDSEEEIDEIPTVLDDLSELLNQLLPGTGRKNKETDFEDADSEHEDAYPSESEYNIPEEPKDFSAFNEPEPEIPAGNTPYVFGGEYIGHDASEKEISAFADEADEEEYDIAYLADEEAFDEEPTSSSANGVVSSEDIISLLFDTGKEVSVPAEPVLSMPDEPIVQDELSLLYEHKAPKKPPIKKQPKKDNVSSILDMIYDITDSEENAPEIDFETKAKAAEQAPKRSENINSYDKFKAIKDFLYDNDEN